MWGLSATLLLLLLDTTSCTFVGEKRTDLGLHIPLYNSKQRNLRRRSITVGLGNYYDVTYSVLLEIGKTSIPLIIDTGSSDLWVVSDTCGSEECQSGFTTARYPQASFQSTGLDVRLLYGDSVTGTHAFGLVGRDSVNLAGLGVKDQYFGAVNNTNTSVLEAGTSGILGLGFPVISSIWMELFRRDYLQKRDIESSDTFSNHDIYSRPAFPIFGDIFKEPSSGDLETRQSSTSSASAVQAILSSWDIYGPFTNRLISAQRLAPLVTIALQRNTIDVGGNTGLLSIGELPSSVQNDSLTWVPLRLYGPEQGGISGPPDSPDERYPIAWEVPIDDVYFDGEKLPRSTLASPRVSLSALVDTGNSLIRGPSDTVKLIPRKLGGSRFLCGTPHILTFQIGGKMFPVDPRDFVVQTFEGSVRDCNMNVVATDAPEVGSGYLYSWSLGDPFLKSVLTSYYYGNLTHPSQDPPRLGFLSTVPSDADKQYQDAVKTAAAAGGGNFPGISEPPPEGNISASTVPATNGVPTAQSTAQPTDSSTRSPTVSRNGVVPGPIRRIGLRPLLGTMFVTTGTFLWS